MILHNLDKHRDKGLLFLRVGIGIAFMAHGWPKLAGGTESWAKVGGALGALGVNVAPTFMGFMAAVAEFGGGLLLALGLFTRPALFLLLPTMLVAAGMHAKLGHGFKKYSHALEAAILFFSLIFIGPGKYSLDEKLSKKKEETPEES
jgi:putative oxidoreductase